MYELLLTVTSRELFKQYGCSQRLYRDVFEPAVQAGLFAPGEQCSAAATLGMLYYYILSHQVSTITWPIVLCTTNICFGPKIFHCMSNIKPSFSLFRLSLPYIASVTSIYAFSWIFFPFFDSITLSGLPFQFYVWIVLFNVVICVPIIILPTRNYVITFCFSSAKLWFCFVPGRGWCKNLHSMDRILDLKWLKNVQKQRSNWLNPKQRYRMYFASSVRRRCVWGRCICFSSWDLFPAIHYSEQVSIFLFRNYKQNHAFPL